MRREGQQRLCVLIKFETRVKSILFDTHTIVRVWYYYYCRYELQTSDLLYQIRLVVTVCFRCSPPSPSILFDRTMMEMFENLAFGPTTLI
jgi:hypothetical protein